MRDRVGNVLVGFRVASEDPGSLAGLDPLPASLVVVRLGDAVLMIFDAWRAEWELPGGKREPGEAARQAAIRELREETGIRTSELHLAGVGEFDLVRPRRREFAAVYRTRLTAPPRLTVNEEALDFRWWDPRTSLVEGLNPIDAELARLVVSGAR